MQSFWLASTPKKCLQAQEHFCYWAGKASNEPKGLAWLVDFHPSSWD
jgi:hypothetical protein